jgi:hypothetical protein
LLDLDTCAFPNTWKFFIYCFVKLTFYAFNFLVSFRTSIMQISFHLMVSHESHRHFSFFLSALAIKSSFFKFRNLFFCFYQSIDEAFFYIFYFIYFILQLPLFLFVLFNYLYIFVAFITQFINCFLNFILLSAYILSHLIKFSLNSCFELFFRKFVDFFFFSLVMCWASIH